jgi:hypothetical protein
MLQFGLISSKNELSQTKVVTRTIEDIADGTFLSAIEKQKLEVIGAMPRKEGVSSRDHRLGNKLSNDKPRRSSSKPSYDETFNSYSK